MFYVWSIGAILLQLVLLNRYFSVLFHIRNVSGTAFWAGNILAGGTLFASSAPYFPMFVTLLLLAGSALLIARFYPVRLEFRLIFSILYPTFAFIAESLCDFIILQNNPVMFHSDVLSLLIYTFTMLLFNFIIRFVKRGYHYKISKGYFLIFALIVASSFYMLNALFIYMEKNSFYILAILCILSVNILVIFLLDRLIERFRLEKENDRLRQQVAHQNNTYEKTTESFKRIKRTIHDTNKHLVYIRTCIYEKKYHEAVQYMNKIVGQLNLSDHKVTTGSLVIDALVIHALNIANNNRIKIKHNIQIAKSELKIDRYDLCIVLGNVLDNALEAARRLPDPSDKFVHLKIFSNNRTLTIHVVNSFQVPLHRALRTKENAASRGVGLLNIQMVAEKYGGHLKTETTPGQFETTVLLPFQE